MIRNRHLQAHMAGLPRGVWADERAAQLVEFAVALPLLVLFVVGIFDFSGAYTLKQKLTNITRDAARVAASGPATDLCRTCSTPASVIDAFNVVDNYLVANGISDCGMTASTVTYNPLTLTALYKVTPSGSPPCGITLTINRGYVFPLTGTTPPSVTCASQSVGSGTAVVGTCVSLQYTYSWRFGRVSSLLGSNTTLPSQISAIGVALNEN